MNIRDIVILILLVANGIIMWLDYKKDPTEKQEEKVKEWLLLAVIEAEKMFGGQTGQIKLRYVFDLFVQRFPAIASKISFETFSSWVDEALVTMRKMIESNKVIDNFIKGE